MTTGNVFRTALARPVTVLMLLVTLIVVGVIAERSVPLQLVPPGFVPGNLSVSIPVPDSTPQEVMERVAEPAEELFRTIPGIRRIRSWSGSSGCSISVEYSTSQDVDAIYADIRDRMERLLPSLPEGADRYRIFRFDLETDLPVISAAATYGESVIAPEALLENVVRPRLEATEGVARVEVQGLIDRQVAIDLHPDRVVAHSVDVNRLISRLRGENILAPGGTIDEGGRRYLLRVSQRFGSLDEIRSLRIGDSLVLGDIADVSIERGVREFLVRVDGQLCNVLRIFKESDANAVEVCRRLNRVLDEELPRDPRLQDFDFEVFFDAGEAIETSIGSLQETCLWGGALAVLVLFVFLRRLRATLLVAAAIPLSLLIAVVVIYFRGGTFNLLSLTGLTLGIGMLIDNAIVVSENIFRKLRATNTPEEAAGDGATEVALAVTLATLTTVAVFVPLIFLGSDSNMRLLMRELGLPVCYSLLASLFVALVFIPTGAARLLGNGAALPRIGGVGEGRTARVYRRALVWGLRHRLPAFLLLGAAIGMQSFPLHRIQVAAEKGDPSGDHYVGVEFPHGATLTDADETMETICRAIEPRREELGIETIAAWFRAEQGTLAMFLEPGRTAPQQEFIQRLRTSLPELAGVEYDIGSLGQDEEKSLRIDATGRDPTLLDPILRDLAIRLRELPGVLEVSTPADDTRQEISVVLQRERAQRYSVSSSQVAGMVGWMLRGAPLPDYEAEGEELPMTIQFSEQEMEGFGDLYRVQIFNQEGVSLPLAALADFEFGRSLPSIRRVDRQVTSRVIVRLEPGTELEAAERSVAAIVDETEVPDGYHLSTRGGLQRYEDDMSDVIQAGLLGLVLIFVLMGVLFESFLLPLSVIGSIPFLFVGAFWSCYLFGETLSGTALIGFIILLGIVVNNAIVLVDQINRFRAEGMVRSRAILDAAQVRLRPIWMTALTTICGLLPLVVLQGDGQGMDYRPLGVVVLGGLTSSTIFTLLAVPLLYSIFDDLRNWLGAGWGRVAVGSAAPAGPAGGGGPELLHGPDRDA